MKRSIPYYNDFLSDSMLEHLLKQATPVNGVSDLMQVGPNSGLETTEALNFLCSLYSSIENELHLVLNRRIKDRKFIDERTRACVSFNQEWKRDFLSADYQTVFGLEDGEGRIVMGPKRADYHSAGGNPIAPLPEYLQGNHVTLFGPPDNAKMSVNAMNAYHRKLKEEPAIVEELLKTHTSLPKWGADDEDSKTPLREDLISAGVNLTGCLDGTLSFVDEVSGKKYELAQDHRSYPIKRFPGIALPCFFLFYKKNPLPLHLYDFALHLFKNWHNPRAMVFYVPKLENEEEARYIRIMLETAEKMIQKLHPEYKLGTIRLMIVLENPRAVFRTHEIMDELYPYFAGASLGWHDFLASTARVFKEDSNYRIPVKADPDIVIKYIKASHDLLANVVGPRGGIKVGGMYGILPITNDLMGPSFQVTIKGYIRDVVTQFKRNLNGFWVAHPDFVRLGMALVEAWKFHTQGDSTKLNTLVTSLLNQKYHKEILDFIHGPDIEGLDRNDPRYPRSLIVADIKESNFIANNHPDEIRYNVFQSLQYITDWLSGNGCVALPTQVGGIPARVMDDLATAERSRWEVWHEIHHGRFSVEEFLKIAFEELHFIRKDQSNDKKIVQVKWDERTEKWYPIALKLMIKLMTDKEPVEFATQLFLPFTVDVVRNSPDPWQTITTMDSAKFQIDDSIERFIYYFEMCGNLAFATTLMKNTAIDLEQVKGLIMAFDKEDIIEAASFHGDIGESKKTLDAMASAEQAKVFSEDEKVKTELRELGSRYLDKFGVKFLISAKGKSGVELLDALKKRSNNTESQELENAREALWEITSKRITSHPRNTLCENIQSALKKHKIKSAQITILNGHQNQQDLAFGQSSKKTWFEMASLSKTVGSAFAIEYFNKKGISLDTSVDELFNKTESDFRLNDSRVKLMHLMSHSALNMHYVNGVPANQKMPPIRDFLSGNNEFKYAPVKVINPPGEIFQYSGGGFLVLEHLIEAMEKKSIFELTRPFLDRMGMKEFSFEQATLSGIEYAHGYTDAGAEIEGTRKMFPAFAAGSMGAAGAMANFLTHLERAFHNLEGSAAISHDTAVQMLFGTDKGCMRFMGCKMGLGIFIAEAGPNKLAIHQGANDGFRCIYLYCFDGPDRGKGLVSLCNADLNGVLFNAEVTQLILKELKLKGVDTTRFKVNFSIDNIPQEEIVNIGYKNLVFNALLPLRPEAIVDKGPKDPLASYNLLVGGKVLEVSNELFARAENLFSDHLPKFDPELFGAQGKIMDSWETVRHNLAAMDYQIIEMPKASVINYILLSTKCHTGNFAPFVKLEGMVEGDQWIEFLPKTQLAGHSEMRIKLPAQTQVFKQIKVSMYPDGGFTRLGLYQNLPTDFQSSFKFLNEAKCIPYTEKVPATQRPLFIKYHPDQSEIDENWETVKSGEEYNNASAALGASIVSATDEHYSPATLVISPFAPINMFDGLESARSRIPGHYEQVVIKLARKAPIHRIEMDYTYFVNNNPLKASVEGLVNGEWTNLVPETLVKPYAGKKVSFVIKQKEDVEQVRVRNYPCGGVNRLKVFSKKC